jgi:hypothetical protein
MPPTDRAPHPNQAQAFLLTREVTDMTRMRPFILAVAVGVLATLPTAGSALAGISAIPVD